MNPKEIERELNDVREFLSNESVDVLEPTNQPFQGFTFDEPLPKFASQALERGATEVYLIEQRDEDGEVQLGGICYFYQGRAHTCYRESPAREEMSQDAEYGSSRAGREESEEEKQRKEEIAEELLTEYEEYLEEDDRFELENRLEWLSVSRLLRMQDRVEEKAKADPEAENRLARAVYEDNRFNRQFNQTDTEMLLNELEIDFDSERVRMDEVHKRAKSLLKVNR